MRKNFEAQFYKFRQIDNARLHMTSWKDTLLSSDIEFVSNLENLVIAFVRIV